MRGVINGNGTSKRILNLWERELGNIAPKSFSDSVLSSEGILRSLCIQSKLKGHRGCVNALCFNTDGTVLLSGSDDRTVMLWNWEIGTCKFSFSTGHTDNILDAQFVPYHDDKTIITCSSDGQVRRADLSKGLHIEVLGEHNGRIHNMAVEPGNPNSFYSCAEDGCVFQYDLRTNKATKIVKCQNDASPQRIELYTIAVDPTNPNIFAIGGSDEYTRIYDIRKYNPNSNNLSHTNLICPSNLYTIKSDNSDGITGLAYSNSGELLVSYFNDNIYLFPRNYTSNSDDNMNQQVKEYKGHINRETVKGAYFMGPRDEYVCSGSDTGHLFFWRKKDEEILRAVKGDKFVVNCVESHPLESVIVTSGIEKDVKIWAPCFEDCVSVDQEIVLAVSMGSDELVDGQLYVRFINYDDDDDGDDDGDDEDDDEDDDDDDDGDEEEEGEEDEDYENEEDGEEDDGDNDDQTYDQDNR